MRPTKEAVPMSTGTVGSFAGIFQIALAAAAATDGSPPVFLPRLARDVMFVHLTIEVREIILTAKRRYLRGRPR